MKNTCQLWASKKNSWCRISAIKRMVQNDLRTLTSINDFVADDFVSPLITSWLGLTCLMWRSLCFRCTIRLDGPMPQELGLASQSHRDDSAKKQYHEKCYQRVSCSRWLLEFQSPKLALSNRHSPLEYALSNACTGDIDGFAINQTDWYWLNYQIVAASFELCAFVLVVLQKEPLESRFAHLLRGAGLLISVCRTCHTSGGTYR